MSLIILLPLLLAAQAAPDRVVLAQGLPVREVPAAVAGRYKVSGTAALRPAKITDDGVHTYLEWSEEQPLPAVFALNALGEEEIVDGYMRAGIFTIDRVNSVLVFRIGKKTAKAVRQRD